MVRPAMVEVAAEKMPKGKKVLAHIEIHPRMGGGHTVRHVYAGFQHEPKEYQFKENEGKKAMAHIARHAGMPAGGGAEEPETADDAGAGDEGE
jgi:hypothetical protein